VSQTLKLLLGTVSAVGNFFIVLFLGADLRGAARAFYRKGLLFLAPAPARARTTAIVDRIGETLERWLIAADHHHVRGFPCKPGSAFRSSVSRVSFILGIQRPDCSPSFRRSAALLGGLIVVAREVLASGWVAAASAFVLFLGIHALESYILTPIIQRHALDIPPATLFAFQILLGVVFAIWGFGAGFADDGDREVMDRIISRLMNSPEAVTA